ncbi:glycosyltransferase family 4 protein [Salegentibacter agarivorans]
MRFAIFTHVIHYQYEDKYYAYSPYVREMNLWLKYVEEVEVIAPAPQTPSPRRGSFIGDPYKHSSLTFTKIPSFNLLNSKAILESVVKIPIIFFKILGAMRRADHLHLRCPGNIGLLAAIAQIFFPKKTKTVKYAGNWDPKAKQPWTYRLQKWILNNRLLSRNIKVLVYGNWPNQSDNIVPFFTASFSEEEKEPIKKDFSPAYKFIFIGNLVEGKGVFEAIDLIDALKEKGVDAELDIYGDGVLEGFLKAYIQKKELHNVIKLKGRKSLEELKQAYQNAHFVVLLSKSEGWPKALAEGMWYGCIPIATRVSCVPWMLKAPSAPEGVTGEIILAKRGILLNNIHSIKFQKGRQFEFTDSSRDVSRTAFSENGLSEIISLIKNPEKLKQMSLTAQKWSQQYTIERFEKAIREILGKPNPQASNHNREPGTENSQPKTGNRELTTENSQSITDNPKQQSPNNKLRTANPQPTTDKQLRILQLIDTLNPGGAERMAVNLANSLKTEMDASFLCCTREEGMLKEELEDGVGYLFLNKKNSFDLKAFWKLREFIKSERIDLVHAHGTSWFWGVLLKVSGLKIKLVWHDHYGNRLKRGRKNNILINSSKYFDGVLVLSDEQERWAKKTLKRQNITRIPNFIVNQNKVFFKDKKNHNKNFIIVCVANLRKPKNHLNLLKAFRNFSKKETKVCLQLIGNDYNDNYSAELKRFIKNNSLEDKVKIVSGTTKVMAYLNNADLAVLSSDWEALPLSVLEYGLAGLPVITTDVGECSLILKNRGILVSRGEVGELERAMLEYYYNPLKREEDALALQFHIKNNYSLTAVLPKLINFYFSVGEEHDRK